MITDVVVHKDSMDDIFSVCAFDSTKVNYADAISWLIARYSIEDGESFTFSHIEENSSAIDYLLSVVKEFELDTLTKLYVVGGNGKQCIYVKQ